MGQIRLGRTGTTDFRMRLALECGCGWKWFLRGCEDVCKHEKWSVKMSVNTKGLSGIWLLAALEV